jgi:ABC-type bacteriocin/lantibiotic exporter with double-glycine peptidase domain
MHTVVVIFFLAAIVFYIIGYNVPAIGLMVLGFVFEMFAWSTWISESFKSRNNEDSENK